ncbi:MAG: DNA-directed RNA polymerase subunit F [Nanoarchaeota archaeon]
MIIELKPLSLTESEELIDDSQEDKKEIKAFIKKFSKISEKDAKKLREELESLESMRVKSEHIAKIVDILPEDAEDVAKIFVDTNLNKEETEGILELVKKYN